MAAEHSEIGRRVRARLESALPAWLRERFDPALLDQLEHFAALLAQWGSRVNLTSRPDDPASIVFHILDSLAPLSLAGIAAAGPILKRLEEGHRVADLGSGAGFPGLILAMASGAEFHLFESRRKRASFLQVVANDLKLENVRIENVAISSTPPPNAPFDLVAARAFRQPANLYKLAHAALSADGCLLLYANPHQDLGQETAEEAGFQKPVRLSYELAEPEGGTERILVIWKVAR